MHAGVPSAPPVQVAPTPAPPPARAPSAPKLNANMTPAPSRPALRSFSGGRRTSGDELIADLFEAMGELHFFPDALEAADFVLRLAMEMIPSRAALVHFYDINAREFVIASAVGASSPQLLLRRHNEGESLLSAAMRKRRAIVVPSTADSDILGIERFNLLGGAKSVIVSPVMKGGRFLGAIEVLNPNDGLPYTDHEGNALDYIAEQFAEFLAERGVVVDPERILRGHPANAR
jgi:putative methionine-R-sulfoxide reductase with GAF domain